MQSVSLYPNCFEHQDKSKTKGKPASIDHVIERIRNGGGKVPLDERTAKLRELHDSDREQYDKLKKKTVCVTWSGLFKRRQADKLTQHSGYVVLDIDEQINVAEQKRLLSEHENVAILFLSPSGSGVKPVIPVSPIPESNTEHIAAFNAVLEVFREYVYLNPDPKEADSQRDASRLCFLAHDPDVVDRREIAKPVSWSMPVDSDYSDSNGKKAYNPPTDSEAREVLKHLSPDIYAEWINVGMACKDAGLPVAVWDDWSKGSAKYKAGECEKKWESFKGTGWSWGSVVYLAKEEGYRGGRRNPPRSAYTPPDAEGDNDLDLSPLPVTEETTAPVFPDYEGELFIGVFQSLYRAYADTHVWSPEMLMAMGIGALSYVAKGVKVRTHDKANVSPLNSYVLAVGESDLTAKSEGLTEIKKFMYQVDSEFNPLSNVQSIEGVITALNEVEGSTERYCLFDEGSMVFENTRRQGTKNLLAGLNELWLCPPSYATARASGTNEVRFPYVCCWGNIPTKLISSVFRHEDMIGGSLNRWLPFFVSPKEKTERYPHAVPVDYDEWIQGLVRAGNSSSHRILTFTLEADDARFAWFEGLRARAIQKGEQIGESRFHTHAVKLAGIFALADNPLTYDRVELQHWEAALSVVRYLSECAEYLFRNVGASRIGELENEVLDILGLHGNEMTLTELTKRTRRFDAEERERILSIMESNRQIVRFAERTDGRPKMMIRRVS